MPPNRTKIAKIVLEALHELGEDLEKKELESADEDTRLFGARSPLDSMGLVNFIADVEDRVADELDVEIILANQSAMSQTHSPFRKVSTCIDYIVELIQNNAV